MTPADALYSPIGIERLNHNSCSKTVRVAALPAWPGLVGEHPALGWIFWKIVWERCIFSKTSHISDPGHKITIHMDPGLDLTCGCLPRFFRRWSRLYNCHCRHQENGKAGAFGESRVLAKKEPFPKGICGNRRSSIWIIKREPQLSSASYSGSSERHICQDYFWKSKLNAQYWSLFLFYPNMFLIVALCGELIYI